MAANSSVASEIVRKYLMDSCKQRRSSRLCYGFLLAAFTSVVGPTESMRRKRGYDGDIIWLLTGSVAELSIDTPMSCIGDCDVMFHASTQLAIPAGCLPPHHLPGEFDSLVEVYEITQSDYPGYVYLVKSHRLTLCPADDEYEAVKCQRLYLSRHACPCVPDDRVKDMRPRVHGPAFDCRSYIHEPADKGLLSLFNSAVTRECISVDMVYCLRCLSWPPQAADWPTRHRNHGWPDSVTVDRVVRDGCDVVQVAHRLCRQHQWMNKHQWRLSFSRAEIVLLNTWISVQQIVYHMLRVFAKKERLSAITDDSKIKLMSNYNIKTLMLWACELKPSSRWTDHLNVVRMCVELLHTLAGWLIDARCKHYFIADSNLFDYLDSSGSAPLVDKLLSVSETWLADWFVSNYNFSSSQINIGLLLTQFGLPETGPLAEFLSSFTKHWISCESHLLLIYSIPDEFNVVNGSSLTIARFVNCMRQLVQYSLEIASYFSAYTFLHVAYKAVGQSLSDELLDVLFVACLQSNDVRRCINALHSSVLLLSQAAKLMKVVGNNSRSTVHLIEIELSKAYLYRALRCKDSDNDSIYSLANVYLAVLYYTTGQYQTAIDHCTLGTRSQDHSQCSSHVVQGELLPKIDDNIDNVLGVVVFYQYVRTGAFNQKQPEYSEYINYFEAELFAFYMQNKCLQVSARHHLSQTTSTIHRRQKCLSESQQMQVSDLMLHRIAVPTTRMMYSSQDRRQMVVRGHTQPVIPSQLDTSELVQLLQKLAVEHLTTFRQLEAREFGSECAIVTTDFEALYAYKRGDYQRCLQLSTHNVRQLCSTCASAWGATFIMVYPEFIQLMDDDVASLNGLTLLVQPDCRGNNISHVSISLVQPDCRGNNISHVSISQLSLSLYLMAQCQMKLHHPVTSLAQTLHYVQRERRGFAAERFTLDGLLLTFTERKIRQFLLSTNNH